MNMVEISYLAVLIGAFSNMFIGWLWYSPFMFADRWMKLIGKREEDLKGGANKAMAYMFVGALIMSYVMANFVGYIGAETVTDAVLLGFWAWLGFVAVATSGDVLFAKKSWELWAVNNSYNLVSMVVMAVIIFLIQ